MTLGYLRARLRGFASLGGLAQIDDAAAELAAERPIDPASVIGQYRAESAAMLRGRPPPGPPPPVMMRGLGWPPDQPVP